MKINKLPEGFVALSSIAPSINIDLKYCGSDNLVGRPLEGYASDGIALITEVAAISLVKIQKTLQRSEIAKQLQMTEPNLLIWDAYRPQMACEDFWQWSQSDCQKTKNDYYPNIDKRDFFKLGYVARKSSHSRGSTVDLNIVDALNGKLIPLDMGTRFDFMDVLSHPDNPDVPKDVFKNRQFLKQLMLDFGWLGIKEEWWHFTFTDEPYPDTYFNFPVINYKES